MEPRVGRGATADRVRELVDSAFAARYHDLTAMLKLSSMAVVLAEEKSLELPPDLVAAAWTQYGNALRMAGRYQEAEKALDRAKAQPASDPVTQVHILEVRASLHRITRRFESAVNLLSSAIEAQRAIGDSNGEARSLNLLGIVHMDAGEYSRALGAFKKALNLLGPDAPLELLVSTGHNMAEASIAAGRLSAASIFLESLSPYYHRLNSSRMSAKAEWMHARLYRRARQHSAAQRAYERAYQLLSTEQRSPEVAELAEEISEFLRDCQEN